MNCKVVETTIVSWLKNQLDITGQEGFVIGISGGVDSALVSSLCAKTGYRTLLISMPIHQQEIQLKRAHDHMRWLEQNFTHILSMHIDLTEIFETFRKTFENNISYNDLVMANLRSRLRMITLYAYSGTERFLVAGTGNKVEDYGVGFFTKYGDGAVDISPIGDLSKSQVWELAKFVGVSEDIVKAKPTDGLWSDNRGDEDAIGATYPELEWAISYCEIHPNEVSLEKDKMYVSNFAMSTLTPREKEVLKIYLQRHSSNQHKLNPIPICSIPKIIL